ncbi:hypothetical protein SDJN02_04832, partial [Cucurbita argyrosperma subsp. argyrosperma]
MSLFECFGLEPPQNRLRHHPFQNRMANAVPDSFLVDFPMTQPQCKRCFGFEENEEEDD